MKSVTAAMTKPARLYHYQPYNGKRLEPTVSGQIYMSNPRGFNDPWDCRPWFNDDVSDPAYRERLVQWFARSAWSAASRLPVTEHAARAPALRNDPALLQRSIAQISSQIEGAIQDRYRVYCLTPKPASTLMWSHYANDHRGICLEFDGENEVMCLALKVEYCDTYPPLDLADSDDQTMLMPLLIKAADWSYEEEYRLIAQEEAAALNRKSLITKNNLLTLPAKALQAVIIGCSTPPDAREEICRIVQAAGSGIAVKQAARVPNHYELAIEPVP